MELKEFQLAVVRAYLIATVAFHSPESIEAINELFNTLRFENDFSRIFQVAELLPAIATTIPVHDHVAVIHVVMTLASLSTPEIWTLEVRIN